MKESPVKYLQKILDKSQEESLAGSLKEFPEVIPRDVPTETRGDILERCSGGTPER